jgi:hypothetical protein
MTVGLYCNMIGPKSKCFLDVRVRKIFMFVLFHRGLSLFSDDSLIRKNRPSVICWREYQILKPRKKLNLMKTNITNRLHIPTTVMSASNVFLSEEKNSRMNH